MLSNMSNYNVVDIIFFIIFFLSILIGFARGFISEFISLVTLIAAFVVALTFTVPLVDKFTNTQSVQHMVNQTSSSLGVNTSQGASYLAIAFCFALLFAATIIVGVIIRALLNIAFTTGVLGFGNRLFGGLFGFVRGFFIILIIIFFVQLSPVSEKISWKESKLVPQFNPYILWLENILSPSLNNLLTKMKFPYRQEDEETNKSTRQ